MQKISAAIVLSVAAIAGAAALILSISNPGADQSLAMGAVNHFDASAATEQRILALEAAVSEERQARQLLEDELLILIAQMEQLLVDREDPAADEAVAEAAVSADSGSAARRQLSREERQTIGRRDALISAGMSPDRAEYILRRESEMRYEQMQAVFEARSSGEALDPYNRSFSADALLRNEIGDAEYEMYLQANNRPTSVGVSSVMASSPGERAGLQAGDQIVGYDGERVFSATELMQRTMTGGDGNVVVDVMRDGSPMQIVVPRGPIGVEIGRFRGR